MVIDAASINARLDKLREQIVLLNEAKKLGLGDFKKDPRNYYTVERAFQLAIEASHDIANHLISSLDMERPDKYESVFSIIEDNKVIPEGFGEVLKDMARFRNLLVHEYLKIDLDRVYEILQSKIGDLEQFAKYIVKFLENQ